MAVHSFKAGDRVTIFQMNPSRGLEIEGKATVVCRNRGVDEHYLVHFDTDEAGDDYERFIDREGQTNPEQYRAEFNKRIGKAA